MSAVDHRSNEIHQKKTFFGSNVFKNIIQGHIYDQAESFAFRLFLLECVYCEKDLK